MGTTEGFEKVPDYHVLLLFDIRRLQTDLVLRWLICYSKNAYWIHLGLYRFDLTPPAPHLDTSATIKIMMFCHPVTQNWTRWDRITHICVGNLIIIGSDNGLSPAAPSHYLSQCWEIVSRTFRNKLQWNFNRNANIFIQEKTFECIGETVAILSRPQ